MLDQEHKALDRLQGDDNIYTLGKIGEHNVVIVCLPAGQIGGGSAAWVAKQMQSTFPALEFGLMVGIGGGVPSHNAEIRLCDVVVSQPGGGHGGVIQYDFGKTRPGRFERVGFLNAPPRILLNAVSVLQADHTRDRTGFYEHISRLPPGYDRKKAGRDPSLILAEGQRLSRVTRSGLFRYGVHYGTIASGNQVMRDRSERDKISAKFGGVLCFEMEAAGLMNNFPCLVVRGISDFADSNKNDECQLHAAWTAASYAKELLEAVPRERPPG